MANAISDFDLITRAIFAIKSIDRQVAQSPYVNFTPVEYSRHTDFGRYLNDLEDLQYWQSYFGNILHDGIDYGGHRINTVGFIIGCLTPPASTIEQCTVEIARRNVTISGPLGLIEIEAIQRRQIVLNAFLVNAKSMIERWEQSHRNDEDTQTGLRRRRPLQDSKGSEMDGESSSDTGQPSVSHSSTVLVPRQPGRVLISGKVLVRAISHNSTLLSLTVLLMLAAAILQTYGFTQAFRSNESLERGSYSEPEFFTAVSSFIMQVLGLYVTLQPALRESQPRTAYARWSWATSLSSFTASATSIAIYGYSPDISQLVAFIGSAMQAVIVLQLVWAMTELSAPLRVTARSKGV